MNSENPLKHIPSVDKVLSAVEMQDLLESFGHTRTTEVLRAFLAEVRSAVREDPTSPVPDIPTIAASVRERLHEANSTSLRTVLNLTGTVLHTNLGRAALPDAALAAIKTVAQGNSNLEYDLVAGARGDRDDHIESLIRELTGAEAATVVNNNAAAVLLCLNTLAFGKNVCISRGELVEIGGSFRIPEVMEKSGCKLNEVGATNRTHLKDYISAINSETALLLKVHTSNYEIRGFTQEVSYEEVAGLAREKSLPFLADLGSGTLVNLESWGLPHEPTVQEVLGAGADIVTFSGDKLLGGPQAGVIAGRKDLVEQIRRNPLKRALRVDKMTITALTEVLKMYRQPELVVRELPTLRHLSRTRDEILPVAEQVLPAFCGQLAGIAEVTCIETSSQIGSGALPLDQLPSVSIQITPMDGSDATLKQISEAFRNLPVPVIGRLHDGRLLFDLRTLDDPANLIELLDSLKIQ